MNFEMYLCMKKDIEKIENQKSFKGSMSLFNKLISKYKVYDPEIENKVHQENKMSAGEEFDYTDELNNLKEVLEMYLLKDKVDYNVESDEERTKKHIISIKELLLTDKTSVKLDDFYTEITSSYCNLIDGFGDNCYNYDKAYNTFWSDVSEKSMLYNLRVLLPKIEHYYNLNFGDGKANIDSLDIINNIFRNFDDASDVFKTRRKGKTNIIISDEYDVQDLLHLMLKSQFNDVIPEEYSINYAGSGSKIDFYIKSQKIGIEVKCPRNSMNDRELAAEIIEDLAKYKEHPELKHILFFIYDKEHRIKNYINIRNDIEKDNKNAIVYFCR